MCLTTTMTSLCVFEPKLLFPIRVLSLCGLVSLELFLCDSNRLFLDT